MKLGMALLLTFLFNFVLNGFKKPRIHVFEKPSPPDFSAILPFSKLPPGLFRRENTFFDQRYTQSDSVRKINREDINRYFANRCFAYQNWTMPFKVVRPSILSRVEKRDVLPLQISRNIWPFVGVTSFTAQSEIVGGALSSVFDGDDVINLKRQE